MKEIRERLKKNRHREQSRRFFLHAVSLTLIIISWQNIYYTTRDLESALADHEHKIKKPNNKRINNTESSSGQGDVLGV
jgi:hypothetical protein